MNKIAPQQSGGPFTGEGGGLWNSRQAPESDFLLAVSYKALPCYMRGRGRVRCT